MHKAIIALTAALLLAACTQQTKAPPPSDNGRFAAPDLKVVDDLPAAEDTLNLVAPPGYVEAGKTDESADWVTPFVESTGCKVSVTVTDSTNELKQLAGSGQYDGVAAPGVVAMGLIGDGKVAPVNAGLVPNYVDVVPGLTDAPWSTVGTTGYGMPHGRSATVLTWRTDKVKPAPTSWSAVYGTIPAPYQGAVTERDSPLTIAAAAVYLRTAQPQLGIDDPYGLDAKQLAAVAQVLKTQRQAIKGYWTDEAQVSPAFKDGSVVIGATTQAAVEVAKAERAPVASGLPKEGTVGDSASWMLAAKAKHPGCMYRWMDHMLDPKTNAAAAQWLGIAPAVTGACQQTTDKAYCTRLRATDEKFWSAVAMNRTPLVDCLDDRGTKCTDYADWTSAWREIVT